MKVLTKVAPAIMLLLLHSHVNALRLQLPANPKDMRALMEKYNNGYWEQNEEATMVFDTDLFTGTSEEYTHSPANALKPFQKSPVKMPRRLYSWRLNEGEMKEFDGNHLCETLKGKPNILVVGDSTSLSFELVLETLMSDGGLVRPPAPGKGTWKAPADLNIPETMQRSASICGGRGNLVYIRNDWLDTRLDGYKPAAHKIGGGAKWCDPKTTMNEKTMQVGHEYSNAACAPWAHPKLLREFDVIVMNTGAHRVPKNEFSKNVKNAISAVKEHAKDDATILFRTTVPGLSECAKLNNQPPFASIEEAEKYIEEHPYYDSAEFKERNEQAKEIAFKAGMGVMDVYPASILRRDGHGEGTDCLHYHEAPSPLMYWTKLMYNLVLDSRA